MPSQKSIPISELITTANSELLRLDFKRSALQIYCAEFRKFSDYYSNEKIQDYTATTGREYFQSIYGVNIASPRLQLTKSQSATRRAIRLLDDIFQFGYALRYCHRSYTVNPEYDILLESYLMKCRKKHNSQGTLRTKQMKLCQFFEYIEGRNIQLVSFLPRMNAEESSDFFWSSSSISLIIFSRISLGIKAKASLIAFLSEDKFSMPVSKSKSI